MTEAGLITALACTVVSLVWLFALAWIGLRLLGGSRGEGLGRARGVLHRRLASGEIDIEEYYERESALRQAKAATRRRR